MSSFIVSNETITNAISAIRFLEKKRGTHYFREAQFDQNIGQMLYNLNFMAVMDRYKGTLEAEPVYKLQRTSPLWSTAEKVQAYKSLQCLRYQCSEGDIVETGTYKELNKITDLMAVELIENTPEYQSAKWNI